MSIDQDRPSPLMVFRRAERRGGLDPSSRLRATQDSRAVAVGARTLKEGAPRGVPSFVIPAARCAQLGM